MSLHSVEELIDAIRQGSMVVLMDDGGPDNQGDLVMAAELVRPEDINFMATHARGLICLTLSPDRCKRLNLPLMVTGNNAQLSTHFTVSIGAAQGGSTGISAAERTRTIRAAVARDAGPADIVQPGHVFPLMAQPGGVLSRAGHIEAGCDLARLAGFEAASVIVEIMNTDGSMAQRAELEAFAAQHGLKIGTIADLIHYRAVNEKTVSCIQKRRIQTQYGGFNLLTYLDRARQEKHFALTLGELQGEPPLVRVHVGNMARDVLKIRRPADGDYVPWTYDQAAQMIAAEGRGVIVLLCHNETPADVEDSIDWMLSGRQERPSPDLVYKQVGTGSQILKDLGVSKMRLMSAPFRFNAISGFDLEVVEYINSRA